MKGIPVGIVMILLVLVVLLAGTVEYDQFVIEGQQQTIRQMAQNPACLQPGK